MDPQGGKESIKRLKAVGNTKADLIMIKNAGHHLYLDNYEATNEMMGRAVREQAKMDE